MSNSEFKARALYEFFAEGPNELSFKANDILTITSNTAGHGWWYAKNASGQVGVIPENYVQSLADPPEPNEPPPPLSTFSHTPNVYPNVDIFNSNNNLSRTSSQTGSHPSYDQHQYMNPTNYNNWHVPETSAWSSPPPPQPSKLLEQKSLTDSSRPLKVQEDALSIANNAMSIRNSFPDEYITVVDITPPPYSNPKLHSTSSLSRISLTENSDEWYDTLPKTPVPTLLNTHTLPAGQASRFHYPESPSVSHGTTLSDDYNVSMLSQQSAPPLNLIGCITKTPPSQLLDERRTSQPVPIRTLAEKDSTLTNLSLKTSMSMPVESTIQTKAKRRFPVFFTLKRKSEEKKKKNADKVQRQASKRDTDSDDSFSDPEYPPNSSSPAMNSHTQSNQQSVKRSNTLTSNAASSNQNRPSLATTETSKAPPRARFFDKHGLDNYLLNGCKTKPEEHCEIFFDEREGGVCWSPNPGIPPFHCKVEEPSKGTKLGGLKAFMEYKIHPQVPGSRPVGRRYKQFDWLHEQLVVKFRFICIPPLPGKQIAGRFEQEFIEERRRQLESWLNRICHHPILCASFPVQHFVTCELSEKNNKDWKTGKRKIEKKDEFREASWLQCVTLANTGISDTQILSQIDVFAQQQPGLESQLKNLSQNLTKYLERHTEVYERDIQRISEVFSKVHVAVQVDTTTPGNKELSGSINKISGSYNGIADLYKTKGSDGVRDLIERIQEYIGLIACFPSILSMQRSAVDFMRTVQQRAPPDYTSAIHRSHVLNHVVLAEINYFQKEKVRDISNYLKTFVDQQTQFYERITSELHDASNTFK